MIISLFFFVTVTKFHKIEKSSEVKYEKLWLKLAVLKLLIKIVISLYLKKISNVIRSFNNYCFLYQQSSASLTESIVEQMLKSSTKFKTIHAVALHIKKVHSRK